MNINDKTHPLKAKQLAFEPLPRGKLFSDICRLED